MNVSSILLVVAVALLVYGGTGAQPTSAADYGAVVDKILEETRAKIPDHVPFTQLHYAETVWNAGEERFDVVARLEGVNGHLELGVFKRDGKPRLQGTTNDQILVSKFIIGLSITYSNFTADNYTSGETSRGQMTVSYDKAEIHTWISIVRNADVCSSSVQSFTPVTLSDPTVQFDSTSTDLPLGLFSKAKLTMNFYLNRTLVTEGLPTFASVVAGPDLCSALN